MDALQSWLLFQSHIRRSQFVLIPFPSTFLRSNEAFFLSGTVAPGVTSPLALCSLFVPEDTPQLAASSSEGNKLPRREIKSH